MIKLPNGSTITTIEPQENYHSKPHNSYEDYSYLSTAYWWDYYSRILAKRPELLIEEITGVKMTPMQRIRLHWKFGKFTFIDRLKYKSKNFIRMCWLNHQIKLQLIVNRSRK